MRRFLILAAFLLPGAVGAGYVNFEVSHVHPLDLTPSGDLLLAVNTPDALLERFAVQPDGSLVALSPVRVGLEPVGVIARGESEAWVVNHLSDSVSIVDLTAGVTTRTLQVGDEPSDVAFAGGKAFVAVSQEDAVKVYDLADLDLAPSVLTLGGRRVRALAVSNDGQTVYAVVLMSGNRTTVVGVEGTFGTTVGLNVGVLSQLGLRDIGCASPPPYPPLPAGIARNPALTDPPSGVPQVGLIVSWNEAAGEWQDETGADWSACLPYTLGDHDLFAIDVSTHTISSVRSLGTSLFEVSVRPADGRIYVPNTDARNAVRFEHPLGVQGHVVDNLLSVVDPSSNNAVNRIELNAHINRASDPATNLAERSASISQPGMMVWNADGSRAYLTAIGSRKLFRVDGACASGGCIFGADRAVPDAVEVGEGPTGVALDEGKDRLYVLNRISHDLAIVRASDMTRLETIPLHDPSSADTRDGRRFLYDGIDSSAHGDAACSSCHLSGHMDGLAWDLGDPTGAMVPYSTARDNVRFITLGGVPCDPASPLCTVHQGFDPQKGPMATQTLRGMLEPLHWRGDRATMNDFNAAFVGLMGRADIGPVNGKPAGLSASEMERFRRFALELRFPPNPHRKVDDTLPCLRRPMNPSCEIYVHGSLFPGNPTEGSFLFDDPGTLSDGGGPCVACHAHPFGAAGGNLGGVTPTEPTSMQATALFNGVGDQSNHNDFEVSHLRNMYEKFGPTWAAPGGSPPETVNGFGFTHDGAIPDLFRFFAIEVFTLNATKVRDMVSFMFHFPTGTRPAVGRQVTLPAGTPPTGSVAAETLLATLVGLGDRGDPNRHCELVAGAVSAGRLRSRHLSGGAWVGDSAADSPLTLQALREAAQSPITFTCGTPASGQRLGGNRDEDAALDGDDCAAGDAGSWSPVTSVTGLTVDDAAPSTLAWDDQAPAVGPGLRYDVLGGDLGALRASGLAATGCLAAAQSAPSFVDPAADPLPGSGVYYVIRAVNACAADAGPGRAVLVALSCP